MYEPNGCIWARAAPKLPECWKGGRDAASEPEAPPKLNGEPGPANAGEGSAEPLGVGTALPAD